MREKVKKFFVHKLNGFYPKWAVMQAKQDIAVKFDNYIVVDLLNERSLGDQVIIDYEKEEASYGGIREATLNVQAFGKGSVEALAYLWLYFQRQMDIEDCFNEGIAVLGASEVRDLTGLLDNRSWQERASVDLTISYARNVEYDVPFFTDFNISGLVTHRNVFRILNSQVAVSSNRYDITKQGLEKYWEDNPTIEGITFVKAENKYGDINDDNIKKRGGQAIIVRDERKTTVDLEPFNIDSTIKEIDIEFDME